MAKPKDPRLTTEEQSLQDRISQLEEKANHEFGLVAQHEILGRAYREQARVLERELIRVIKESKK